MALKVIIEGLLGKLAADEIKAWLPTISHQLSKLAISRLPEEQRERYSEEWAADVLSIPGDVSKLVFSVGLFRAALRIARIHRPASKSPMIHKIERYINRRQRDIAGRIHMTMAWIVLPSLFRLAGAKAGDRITFSRDAEYSLLFQIETFGSENGECPLWLSCLATVTLFISALSWEWMASMNRKWLELEKEA